MIDSFLIGLPDGQRFAIVIKDAPTRDIAESKAMTLIKDFVAEPQPDDEEEDGPLVLSYRFPTS